MIDIAIILISVICDALRDNLMLEMFGIQWSQIQWEWHLVKWIAMFVLWGRLTWNVYKKYGYGMIIILAISCNIIWQLFYRL